jgi:hypothetical protein
VEDGFDLTDLREFNPTPPKVHGIMLRHLKGLYRILLRLESRESLFLTEEPRESVIEVLVRVLKRLGVDLFEPWMLFFEDRKTVVQVIAGEFFAFLFVCPDLLLQRMVVHKPTGMDVFHEHCGLLTVRVHPILVGLEHTGIC